jgi:chromosome segregation ATPase
MSGLSPYQNKSEQTSVLLREMLAVLSDFGGLLNNPTELSKRITDAIKLAESELKKVEDAKAYLSEAKQTRVELQKLDKSVSDKRDETKSLVDEQNRLLDSNKSLQAKLEVLSKAQTEKEKLHTAKDEVHAKERRELDDIRSSLQKRSDELDKKHRSILEHEARTKEQAERLRRAAEGL